jgi:hypothetical protein
VAVLKVVSTYRNHGKTTSAKEQWAKINIDGKRLLYVGKDCFKNHRTAVAQAFPLCISMGNVGTSFGIINAASVIFIFL